MKQNRDEADVDRLERELMALDHDCALQDAFAESKLASSPIDAETLLDDRWAEGADSETDTSVSVAHSSNAIRSRRRRGTVVLVPAAILLFAMLLPVFWSGGDATTGTAFARMQERVRQVRSVQYSETESFPDTKYDIPTERRVYILGRHLWRVESRIDQTIVDQTLEAVFAKVTGQIVMGPYISISNLATGKHVMVYPDEKRFFVLTHQIMKDKNGKIKSKEELKPNLEIDLYEQIRTIPAGAVRELGESEIDGKQAIGFAFESDQYVWKRSDVYWIDPDSRLPVKIVVRLFTEDTGAESQRWVLSDFVFDQALDRSLFDTNPPEGYTVEEDVIEGIDLD